MGMRWAQYWAYKYQWAIKRRPDIDMEDLLQAALMGEYIAKSKYDPERGSFATVSAFYIRKEIRDLLGIRRGNLPPVVISLDEPFTEDADETRLDMLPDETLPDKDELLHQQERRDGVRAAIDRIKDHKQREAIRMCYLEGKGAREISKALGVHYSDVYRLFAKGRSEMRHDRLLRELVGLHVPFINVSVRTFNSTHMSAVEYAVFRLEEEREKIMKQLAQYEQDAQEEYCKHEEKVI